MKPKKLRIIGGKWRSRTISCLNIPALRPTPNRIRETLFNWLRPMLNGAQCLDCFAGSGALTFEALSQGAAQVVCIEQASLLVEQLHQTAQQLSVPTTALTIVQANALEWLKQPCREPFDIVFLDPPYHQNWLLDCFQLLKNGWLKNQAWIYCEHHQPLSLDKLPEHWSCYRSQKAGQIYYYLLRYPKHDL